MPAAQTLPPAGRWPHRLALAMVLATLPLIVFGGSVTTLRAGLAIDGWWWLEPGRGDHFLLAYPWHKWTRDAGTFVEHTHRLFGTLVGLLAIACLAASLASDRWRPARVLAGVALLAVCVQGLLGGLRVLEKSQDLAFLHGVLAQGVFALLGASAVVTSRRWRELPRTACKHARGLGRGTAALVAVVYLQIAVGAWLRHSGSHLALALHVLLVLAVAGLVLAVARRLGAAAGSGLNEVAERAPLRAARRNLLVLFWIQVALGVLATASVFVLSGGFQGAVSTGEMLFATAHVLVGALLLLASLAAALWSRRLLRPMPAALVAPAAALEGAR